MMANIMIRKTQTGALSFYLPKRDLEDDIVSIEFDRSDKWGGELTLASGGVYYIDPLDAPPSLPISLRARRVEAAE